MYVHFGRPSVPPEKLLRTLLLIDGNSAAALFEAILILANRDRSESDEYFIVDGTLLAAWASQKSFRPHVTGPPPRTGGNPTVDFRGHQCRNATFVVEYQTDWSMKRHSLHPWSMGKYKPRRIGRASRAWITLA